MAPLTTSSENMLWTSIFVLLWTLIHRRVRKSGPFRNSEKILHTHSWIQVFLSSYLLAVTLLSVYPLPPSLSPNTRTASIIAYVQSRDSWLPRYSCHLSKHYEYLDIFLFVANGGKVDLHFGFHHLTTPYLTYFRVLNEYEGWQVFAALNAFHHILMHGFFAGVSKFHVLLPWTRYIQLVVGLGWDAWIIWTKEDNQSVKGNVVAMSLLMAYFGLLTREILIRRREGRKGKEKKEKEAARMKEKM